MKIIERIYNAATDETTDVERDMTKQELIDNKISIETAKEWALVEANQKAAKEAAQAKLAALGLTIDDLQALGI
jgi:phage anti-repressor protein